MKNLNLILKVSPKTLKANFNNAVLLHGGGSKKMKDLLALCNIPSYAIKIQKVIRGIQSRRNTAVTTRPTHYMLKKAWPEGLKSLLDDGISKKEIKKFRDNL